MKILAILSLISFLLGLSRPGQMVAVGIFCDQGAWAPKVDCALPAVLEWCDISWD